MAFLLNLPNRGCFVNLNHVKTSTPSSYICLHDTDPPETQKITTDQTNILIRTLSKTKISNSKDNTSLGKKKEVVNEDKKFRVDMFIEDLVAEETKHTKKRSLATVAPLAPKKSSKRSKVDKEEMEEEITVTQAKSKDRKDNLVDRLNKIQTKR